MTFDLARIQARLAAASHSAPDAPPLGQAGDLSAAERSAVHARLGRAIRPAGVLILLVERQQGLHVVLTQRTAHLHDHAGQISFPGGRQDAGDRDIIATALREAHEEIGADPARIEVMGTLPHYVTVTAYDVTPVVAVSAPQPYRVDPFEVADVFEVPLDWVIEGSHWRRDTFLRDGQRREYWAVPWRERYIWGATAGMLRTFRDVLLTPATP
ncbi:MAG: CoA pyrophosphatase [Burkholderiales bacterium]|nr:CoA pyrophosphatase [Burkholderiales bacterium]